MKVQAIILDWAGTAVDPGSTAPVRAIQKAFGRLGVEVADEAARRDMGLPKREHLRNLLRFLGHETSDATVDRFYAEFVPLQTALLDEYSPVIPGVVEAVERLRARGVKIGSTTGYTRPMLDIVMARARREGYEPDCSLTPEEASGGRPHPYMIFEAAKRLARYPLSAFVKVGDTPVDIEEGRNAGTWTVAVSETGNSRRAELAAAEPHFIIDSVAQLEPVVDEIETRLAAGSKP